MMRLQAQAQRGLVAGLKPHYFRVYCVNHALPGAVAYSCICGGHASTNLRAQQLALGTEAEAPECASLLPTSHPIYLLTSYPVAQAFPGRCSHARQGLEWWKSARPEPNAHSTLLAAATPSSMPYVYYCKARSAGAAYMWPHMHPLAHRPAAHGQQAH